MTARNGSVTKSDPPRGSAPFRRHRAARWAGRLIIVGGLSAATLGCDDPEVRYGPVGGLRVRGSGNEGGGGPSNACEIPPEADLATCPDWATEVFPLFDSPQYACTSNICHGVGSDAAGLTMPAGDAAASYAAMANFTRDGRPYVSSSPEEAPYLMCNIWRDAPVQVGVLMPVVAGDIQLVEGADLGLIGNWADCGMPQEGGAIAGAGGGGMGGGGIGGAGGAGGGI